MVGLPGQTLCDLAGDVAFFKSFGANMIGMVRGGGGNSTRPLLSCLASRAPGTAAGVLTPSPPR